MRNVAAYVDVLCMLQVDELNRSVSNIGILVDKIKHNHNIILASVQNNEAKDETNDLMTQIKKISQRVHGGLKRVWGKCYRDMTG